jgi:hypothetical protein
LPFENIQGLLETISYKKQGIPAFFMIHFKGVFKALQRVCDWRETARRAPQPHGGG